MGSGAQVVIDVGEPKDTIVEDLDALQEQTGIPFVHVSATIETMGDAYRKLGELLGMEEEAETLATYCDETYAMVKDVAEHVEKANLLYITGDAGLNVIAQGSYHAEIIDLLSNNLAVVDSPSSKGTGNEVDMEQLMLWNPDVILFAPDSVYASVGDDPLWQSLTAIQNGSYYVFMSGLSKMIADFFVRENVIEHEEYEIYKYGSDILLEGERWEEKIVQLLC